jgi:hypothetical protein
MSSQDRTPEQRHKRRVDRLQRRVEFLNGRIERKKQIGTTADHDIAEVSALNYAIGALNENQRLRDLIRYCRHELHDEGLITDEEFAALVEVGSESARRLESYDAMRDQIEALHEEMKGKR